MRNGWTQNVWCSSQRTQSLSHSSLNFTFLVFFLVPLILSIQSCHQIFEPFFILTRYHNCEENENNGCQGIILQYQHLIKLAIKLDNQTCIEVLILHDKRRVNLKICTVNLRIQAVSITNRSYCNHMVWYIFEVYLLKTNRVRKTVDEIALQSFMRDENYKYNA